MTAKAPSFAEREVTEQSAHAARIVAYVRSANVTHEQAIEYVALGLATAKTQGVIESLAPLVSPQLVQMDDRTGASWDL